MSNRSIDERIVEMQFNNKQFESGIKDSLGSIDKLKKGLDLDGAAKSLSGLSDAGKKFSLAGIAEGVETIAGKFTTLGIIGITALQNITNKVIDLGLQMTKSLTIDPVSQGFNEYELKMGSIQTIMAGTGASLDEVNRKLNELNTYSDRTIYSFSDMTTNIGKFTNAGVSLDKSVGAIQGISNAAALAGANSNEASRAMYNFAQAISSGYVKLIDWKSIELANMATVEFKNQLIQGAVAAGTLKDAGNGLYETYKGTLISATKEFNNSLQDQWMTSEVLIDVLGKYSDETTEIGKRAFAAAQDVKTFSQLMDTLKEAVGSGWAQTFELVVGDFNEAKELFTSINSVVGTFVDRTSDARNELLSGALTSGWKQLMKEGIGDSAAFIETVTGVAREQGLAIDKMIEDAGSFEKTLKDGWLTSDMLSSSISKMTEKLSGMSDEELKAAGYTKESVEELKKLDAAVKDGSISMEDLAKKIASASGREILFEGLANVIKALGSVLKPVIDGFRDIFPPMTSEKLLAMITAFRDFTATLKIGDETADKIRRTFAGVFAVFDLVGQAIGFVFKVAGELFGLFAGPTAGGILGVTANFGDFLVKLNEAAKKGDVFNKAFEKVRDVLTTVSEKIKDAVERIKTAFGVFPSIDLGPVGEFSDKAEEKLRPFSRIAQIFGAAFEAIIKVIEWAAPIIKKVGGIISEALGGLADKVTNAVSNMEFGEVLDLINSGLFTGILVGINKFINGLKSATLGDDGFLGTITGILDGVRGSLEAYQANIKSKTLLTIAIAIGILAASLFLLSTIDSDKLQNALSGITVLFIELSGAMIALNKAVGTKMARISLNLVAFAAAILILSFAMKNLAELDWDDIAKGTIGIAALMAMLVGVSKAMSKMKIQLVQGSVGLIAFAASILILTQAVKQLGGQDLDDLAKGLGSVAILLAAIAGFSQIVKPEGMVRTGIAMAAMGAAMLIFTQSVKQLGEQDLDVLAKGIGSIAVVLATIAGFTQIVNPERLMSTGLAMNLMGSALIIMTQSVKQLGGQDLNDLTKGLGGVAVLLASLAGFTQIVKPDKIIAVGFAMNIMGSGLLILAKSVKQLGGQDLDDLAKGLGSIAVLLAAIAGFTHLVKAEKILSVSAAIVVMGAGLLIMAQVVKTLGSMPIDEIVIGLVSLAGVFAVLGLAAKILTPVIPAMLGLSAAILILGAGIALVGVGILAFATGLSALSVSASAAAGAIVIIGNAVLSLIPIFFEKIGEGIIALGGVIINGAPIMAEAIIALVKALLDTLKGTLPDIVQTVFDLIIMLLDKLNENIGPIVEKVAQLIINIFDALGKHIPEIVKAGLGMFVQIFGELFSGIDKFTMDDVLKLSGAIAALVACFTVLKLAKMTIKDALLVAGEMLVVFGILTTVFLVLANVGADKVLDIAMGLSATLLALSATIAILAMIPIPAALTAVAGLGVFVGGLTVLLAALGALKQIPGFEWIIGEGTKVMGMLGAAIGEFVGNIVGHFMTGVSSSFEQIGKDLSAFMEAVAPFVEGAKNMDESSMRGVKALAEVILILTAAGILEGLTSWLTGGSSIVRFGKDLEQLGPSLMIFAKSIEGIAGTDVEAAANAAKMLAEMAKTVPNEGGVAAWFAGENDLAEFGKKLADFGPHLMTFAHSIKGIGETDVVAAANAAKTLAEMAATVPNEGGVAAWFAGENDLGKFAEKLANFGPSLMTFARSIDGIGETDVIAAANAAKTLSEMAATVPNEGGVAAWFAGENDLLKFAQKLADFGPYLMTFAKSIEGIGNTEVTAAASAAKMLAEMAAAIPNTGGIASWFAGDNSVASFGKDLVAFGDSLMAYFNSVKDLKLEQVSGVIDQVSRLVDLANALDEVNAAGMSNFIYELTAMGTQGITSFVAAFENSSDQAIAAVNTMLTYVINAMTAKHPEVVAKMTSLMTDLIGAMNAKSPEMSKATTDMMVAVVTAMSNKTPDLKQTVYVMIMAMVVKINDQRYLFVAAGTNLVDGFIIGIESQIERAARAAAAMAKAALDAANKVLDIDSPSGAFEDVGMYGVLGFANGFTKFAYIAAKAASNVGESTISSLSMALGKVSDVVSGDLDMAPTIRPVIDLTDVKMGADTISGMLSKTQSINVSGTRKVAVKAAQDADTSETGSVNKPGNKSTSFSFTQNNYSPKALSRADIYRNTKNQFSALKGVVNTK